MYDMLPFPSINATKIEELSFQTNTYLIQFKEALEFILTNIGEDNLSPNLIETLNSLGAEVENTIEKTDDQFQQVAGNTITIADVIYSLAFKEALKNATPKEYLKFVEVEDDEFTFSVEGESGEVKEYTIKSGKTPNIEFSVNFDTGNLEYTTS